MVPFEGPPAEVEVLVGAGRRDRPDLVEQVGAEDLLHEGQGVDEGFVDDVPGHVRPDPGELVGVEHGGQLVDVLGRGLQDVVDHAGHAGPE